MSKHYFIRNCKQGVDSMNICPERQSYSLDRKRRPQLIVTYHNSAWKVYKR